MLVGNKFTASRCAMNGYTYEIKLESGRGANRKSRFEQFETNSTFDDRNLHNCRANLFFFLQLATI